MADHVGRSRVRDDPTHREAVRLINEATRLLHAGDVAAARDRLTRALAVAPLPAASNNLAAIALDVDGNPQDALKWLEPNLQFGPAGHPFAHALAARCYVALDQPERAAAHLREAVDRMDDLRRHPGRPARFWREYTGVVIQAAGTLGDDGQAWNLYRRWQDLHLTPHSHLFGGIAAFNLGRVRQAQRVWHRARTRGWEALGHLAAAADLFDRGICPPLRLPYRVPDLRPLETLVQRAGGKMRPIVEELLGDPFVLMLALHALLLPPTPGIAEVAPAVVGDLVANGGPWGHDLGRRLLDAAGIPEGWKVAAADGLLRAGVLAEGEPVPMLIGGKRRQVTIHTQQWDVDPDPALDRRLQEASALRDAGRLEDARRMLEEILQADPGRLYYPAAVAYTALLLDLDHRAEARRWLEMLQAVTPGHPGVLYHLATLSLVEGNAEKAREYLAAINQKDLSPELAQRVQDLEQHLAASPTDLQKARRRVARLAEDFRRQVDSRPISPGALTLERALARVPAEWLNAACDLYGIEAPAALKTDRARQLARRILADPPAALRALADLDPAGRATRLLQNLLHAGGVLPRTQVVREFGSDRGDGFWWTVGPPHSPLGHLRLAGLAFVGRAHRGERWETVVAVPVDLRDSLARALQVED
jgi:tetratricopeptide (TPR) repeat protein